MSVARGPVASRSGAERVLALARKRGPRGVHSSDFDTPGQTADGGPPIRRIAARVDELRNQGHVFETRKRRDRTVDYVLVRDADELAAAFAGMGPGQEGERIGPAAAAAAVDVEDLAEQLPLELDDSPAPSSPSGSLYDWDGDE